MQIVINGLSVNVRRGDAIEIAGQNIAINGKDVTYETEAEKLQRESEA